MFFLEYVDNVNNSVYTNFGAKLALEYAVEAGNFLSRCDSRCDSYKSLADSLVILFDESLGIHPEYEGYNGAIIKQADVVLLHYPLGMKMSPEVQAADLDFYTDVTDPGGPAMTWGMHSIGYHDLHQLEKAAKFLNMSFQDNMQAPFQVWTETPDGNAGNFITGAGGFLQTVLAGYGGIRISSNDPNRLSISGSSCPEISKGLLFEGVNYLGSLIDISFECSDEMAPSSPTIMNFLLTENGPLVLFATVYSTDKETPMSQQELQVGVAFTVPMDTSSSYDFYVSSTAYEEPSSQSTDDGWNSFPEYAQALIIIAVIIIAAVIVIGIYIMKSRASNAQGEENVGLMAKLFHNQKNDGGSLSARL